ncbi:helix-turn-helix domain-containing protein [Streptomyces sp. WMMB 322]|uniref:helix-turn-helix domain-containing protein n=1 Tax=Streptomyces sp. WMMB 322 TaxID=1286821 RepID=UPI0006E1E5AD|nr:helix-turn-helix domain-containing protein [Streptomyces sp. WMMB 322]SCK06018.1 transcriptional regulator, AlpA family [Streptomyces sp. WMMB 322]
MSEPTTDQRPLKVKDVAALLDVHVATVYREIEAGRLHAIRVGAGRGTLRIPRPAYDAYVSSAGTAPAAEAA